MRRILEPGDLALAPFLELLGSGGVVAVAIDDHDAPFFPSTQYARHVVEQLVHRKAPRNHALLVDGVDDDFEAAPVRLEAERMGVELAGFGQLRRLLALGQEPVDLAHASGSARDRDFLTATMWLICTAR